MPRLRTDDAPRKLRAVWLGPAGHTLPFQWTYVQWAVTLVVVPVAGTIGTFVVWLLLRDPVWAFGLGGLWCGAGGVYLAVHLMRNVTFDEPLSYQRRLIRGEFAGQFSQPVGSRRIAVEFAAPSIDYLSATVRRAMDWDVPGQSPLAARDRHDSLSPPDHNPYLTTPVADAAGAAARPDCPPPDPVAAAGGARPNPYVTTSP